MGTFTQKTDYLIETKGLLKDRINSLGGSITSGTTFRDYLVWLDSLYEALEEKTITGLPDSLEGKCEQSGTPTPDSPIPIETRTGRQVVSVCGKNLFTGTLVQKGFNSNTGQLFDNNTRVSTETYLSLKAGTYKLSVKNSTNRQLVYYVYDNAGTYLSGETYTGWQSIPTTISLANDRKLRFGFRKPNNDNITPSEVEEIQLEKGNQATTYEEYKGNDYEINLGKNLLPNNATTTTINGITYTINEDKSININGTATGGRADLWLYGSSTDTGNYIFIPKGNYTINTANLTDGRLFLSFREKTAGVKYVTSQNHSLFDLLAQQDCYLYGVMMGAEQGQTFNNITIYPQLEKGSVATSYAEYKTPIYLGKIGTYQDYIFKNTTENPLYDSTLEEGQWYIHKEIGKVVLTGASSESWAKSGSTDFDRFYAPILDLNTLNTSYGLSNYFNYNLNMTSLGDYKYEHNSGSQKDRIFINYSTYGNTTLVTFKTWLSSHNVEVYYVLNTPTNTLIEDEELINQLNEIEIFTVISEDFYN